MFVLHNYIQAFTVKNIFYFKQHHHNMQIRFDELSSMIQALTLEDDKARISQLQDIKTLLIASPSATTFNGAVRASDITNLFTSLSSDNE